MFPRRGRCVPTADRGLARAYSRAIPLASCPDPLAFPKARHSSLPRKTRLPQPGPGQDGGIDGAGGKLVERLQSPLPDPRLPVSQAVRSSSSSQSPPKHLPASAARPGLGWPVARSWPPEPEPRQSAGPEAGAASSQEADDRRRAPRASVRAGGRLEPRCCCCGASPHPFVPRSLPLLPHQPPSSLLASPSLRPPLSLSFSPFGPFRLRSLSRTRSFSYLLVSPDSFGLLFL